MRWALEMTMYGDHHVVYRPGEENNADGWSRLTDTIVDTDQIMAMLCVNIREDGIKRGEIQSIELTATLEAGDDQAADVLCVKNRLKRAEIHNIEAVHEYQWAPQIKDERCKKDLSEDYELLSTALMGESEILSIDKDGRTVFPDTIRARAGLTDLVTFVGQGFKFQIWEPSRFAAYREEANSRMRALRQRLGAKGSAGVPPQGGGT